jgi:hypothetical protein
VGLAEIDGSHIGRADLTSRRDDLVQLNNRSNLTVDSGSGEAWPECQRSTEPNAEAPLVDRSAKRNGPKSDIAWQLRMNFLRYDAAGRHH